MKKSKNEFDKEAWKQEKISPFVKTVLKDAQLYLTGSCWVLEESDVAWNRTNLDLSSKHYGAWPFVNSLLEEAEKNTGGNIQPEYFDAVSLRFLEADYYRRLDNGDESYCLSDTYSGLMRAGVNLIIESINHSDEFSDELIENNRTKEMSDIYMSQANIIENKVYEVIDSAATCLELSKVVLNEINLQKFLNSDKFQSEVIEIIKTNRIGNGAFISPDEESAFNNLFLYSLELEEPTNELEYWIRQKIVLESFERRISENKLKCFASSIVAFSGILELLSVFSANRELGVE